MHAFDESQDPIPTRQLLFVRFIGVLPDVMSYFNLHQSCAAVWDCSLGMARAYHSPNRLWLAAGLCYWARPVVSTVAIQPSTAHGTPREDTWDAQLSTLVV